MAPKRPKAIQEFPLSSSSARTLIMDLANHHSHRIRFSRHVRERMQQRGVSNRQIFQVLRSKSSRFTEPPHPTASGSWKFNLLGRAAGDWIEVVIDLKRHDHDPSAYLVTVMVK